MSILKRPGYSWNSALILLGVALAAEFLPVLGGTGENMRFDWSFTYVTLHFVLLPLGAVVHIVWNLSALAFRRSRELRERTRDVASTLVSFGYLALLQARPLFPLWGDLLWRQIQNQK